MNNDRDAAPTSARAATSITRSRNIASWRVACVLPLLAVGVACSSNSDSSQADTSAVIETDGAAATSAAGASETEPSTTLAEAVETSASSPAVTVPDGQTSVVVESTPEQYFVLFVRPAADSTVEVPVAVVRGEAGTTTLTDGRNGLAEDRYRVETMSVASPGDVDGDGIDDLTELDDPIGSNPVNGAPAMDIETGAVNIPDRATFETLSYQGDDIARDDYLAGLEFVKFWIVDTDTPNPKVYFMNTNNHNAHPPFASLVGINSGGGGRGPQPGKMRGDIVFSAEDIAPDGSVGRYRFAFQPNDAYSYAEIAVAFEALVNAMPELGTKLYFYPFPQSALPLYEAEKSQYEAGRVPVLVE